MRLLAFSPSSVPAAISERRRSPVEMCLRLKRSAMPVAWVPFPAPGGPNRIKYFILFVKYIHVFEVASELVVIESVADYEFIGDIRLWSHSLPNKLNFKA